MNVKACYELMEDAESFGGFLRFSLFSELLMLAQRKVRKQ